MKEAVSSIRDAKTYEEIVLYYESLNLSPEEITYKQIMRLYDLAQIMLDALEQEGITNIGQQLNIAQPVIEKMIEAADELSQHFMQFLEKEQKPDIVLSKEVDRSIRKFFYAMDTFREAIQNITDES